jgi:hypothetical protein
MVHGFEFRAWNPIGNGTELPAAAAAQLKARFDGSAAPTMEELQGESRHLSLHQLEFSRLDGHIS